MGHTVTNESWSLMVDWAVSHRFNEPSPGATGDRSPPGICDRAAAAERPQAPPRKRSRGMTQKP